MPTYFETTQASLLAAEFPYFRLPREKWELMLARLRQMGANALTLTLPWGFHETEPGAIDLTGAANSRRDVTGLVQLCAALDFVCILELGPYSGDGVLGHGLPVWLLQSNDLEGALPEAVERWFKAVSRALAGQQWPAGPIVALHVENESGETGWPALSSQLTEVKWRIWLRKHYEGIEALNAAYGSTYHTVNEVKFPENWATASTPLAQDARTFIETVRHDTRTNYRQLLLDQGWQTPIYFAGETGLAPQSFNLADSAGLAALSELPKTAGPAWLNLQKPIQADPDPVDIGRGPVWAAGAPIRADGSARPTFWQVRQRLWPYLVPDVQQEDQTLKVALKNGAVVTRKGDAPLKLELPPSAKTLYRLRFSGEFIPEENLKASRGKLSGLYLAEDNTGQTDLILALDDVSAPLADFPLTYLGHLLAAQAQTLARSAALAATLTETLAPGEPHPEAAAPARPPKTSYVLEESRRGLREADAALRKALSSISALEGGMAAILGKETSSQPAVVPVVVNPALFEGQAREVLTEIGAACAKIRPVLHAAVDEVQRTLAAPGGFTIAHYQQSYAAAVAAARAAREPLLEVIALLRLEIAAERLPLVAWRVHHQIQELAESLRWGVLRG